MPGDKEQRTGFMGHAFSLAKVNSDLLNCLGGRAEAGRREQKGKTILSWHVFWKRDLVMAVVWEGLRIFLK